MFDSITPSKNYFYARHAECNFIVIFQLGAFASRAVDESPMTALTINNVVVSALNYHLGVLPGNLQIGDCGVAFVGATQEKWRLGDRKLAVLSSHIDQECCFARL